MMAFDARSSGGEKRRDGDRKGRERERNKKGKMGRWKGGGRVSGDRVLPASLEARDPMAAPTPAIAV